MLPLAVLLAFPTVASAAETPRNLDQADTDILQSINTERQRAGLSPLRADARLASAAFAHDQRMDNQRCFDHQCPGEADLGSRVDASGYPWTRIGENLAMNIQAPADVVRAWLGDAGHRSIMLGSGYQDVGCARLVGVWATLWTCDFGSQGSAALPPAPLPSPTSISPAPRLPTPAPVAPVLNPAPIIAPVAPNTTAAAPVVNVAPAGSLVPTSASPASQVLSPPANPSPPTGAGVAPPTPSIPNRPAGAPLAAEPGQPITVHDGGDRVGGDRGPGETDGLAGGSSDLDLWLVVLTSTEAFSPDLESIETAESGDWYRVVTLEDGWSLSLWEYGSPEDVVWIELGPDVALTAA